MNIPSLCIHLDRAPEFNPNKETHLKPILATNIIDQLMGESIKPFEGKDDIYQVEQKHFTTFLDRIASDLEINVDQIVDFELSAYDSHRPAIFGLHNEFVASPRLDNLASSLCSLDSLIAYSKEEHDDKEAALILLFDHEEIGSRS
jgi:aspartyl aminopeptidase